MDGSQTLGGLSEVCSLSSGQLVIYVVTIIQAAAQTRQPVQQSLVDSPWSATLPT